MVDRLILLFTYNKIYFAIGAILLLLILLPTKEKISTSTKKALYVFLIIWIVCFAYRVNTGRDIIYLFKSDKHFDSDNRPTTMPKGPFNKYYSNEAGRKAKGGE